MIRRTYLFIQITLGIYFIVYFIAVANQSDFWGNVLSPFGAIFAFLILLAACLKSKQMEFCWLFVSLACLSWATADIVWAICEEILSLNPESMDLLMYLYLLPNIFIAIGTGAFFMSQWHKWNKVQLVLDVLAITVTGLTITWILFFQKRFEMLFIISATKLTSFTAILCDLFAGCCIGIWFSSIRVGNVSGYIRLVIAGVFMFTAADLFYINQIFNNQYVPNSLVDFVYMASLLIIANGGLQELCCKERDCHDASNFKKQENTGTSNKGIILLSLVMVLIFVNKLGNLEVVILGGIIVLYQVFSSYVQYTIRNEQLLLREKKLNTSLEEKIAEHIKELIEVNKSLEILSRQDTITGLFNRRYFLDSLDQMLRDIDSNESVVLFFMDLDRFKAINDSCGHDIGDKVLKEIAGRLSRWNSSNGLLARLGGDEFVFALRGCYQYTEIKTMAEELVRCCSESITLEPYQFNITLSIGITLYPADALERSTLMKNADIAMYHSKYQGYNQFSFFNSALETKIRRKNKLELLLKNANFDNEFELYYQPQIRIPENKLIGAEALLRWSSREYGSISPSEFIPIAEEIGIIVPLGKWVMKEAVHQISLWNTSNNMDLKVGINISPKQFDSPDFVDFLKDLISKYKAKPEWLDIEITESIAMKGELTVQEVFAALTELGVSISIDDFGTGYSSLSYIKRFSIDRLKIAKPLVDNISTSNGDAQIVKAIVMMAKAMGIKTIAEGVEYEEQSRLLIDLQCDEIQGYIFGRPVPASEFEKSFCHAAISGN
ncbi:MAG TPA: EAL domain-containing protein [Pseudobacteroides sp.]|uniref:putative bifunctional diguanylate cyclase/phosphodiesterase n=1 Tax=Pseudobacteroides sp. TaxID=1968840 RepID=UPI002F9452BD